MAAGAARRGQAAQIAPAGKMRGASDGMASRAASSERKKAMITSAGPLPAPSDSVTLETSGGSR